MKFVGVIILMACVAKVFAWDFLTKNCCEPHDNEHLGRICNNGERAPIIGCCGNGPCNIACCNCDGGCISGAYKRVTGFLSAEITPNLGFSGGSQAAAGSKFVEEAIKTAVKESSKAVLAVPKE